MGYISPTTHHKKTRANSDYEAYKKIRNHVNKEIRKSKHAVNDKLAEKLNNNTLGPKDWWKTLKQIIKPSESSNMPLLCNQGELFSDNKDKAEVFNDFSLHKTLLMKQMRPFQRLTSKINTMRLSTAYIYLPLKSKLFSSH